MMSHPIKGFSQTDTNLRREDVVGHIPDSLFSTHIGVAHSFHFGGDRADCCVSGLVAFLIDEHPPVRDTQQASRKVCEHIRTPLYPSRPSNPMGKDMYMGDVDILHSYSTCQQHTSQGHMYK